MVQSAHAVADFIFKYPQVAKEWHETSNFLVILSVPTESALSKVSQKLTDANLLFSPFHEPDINNELTAIAIEPSDKAKKFCSRFKLVLRDRSK
ncbi:hypothetical protein LCGC14_1719050 [marine sediment metagenome]|uniref:peptidyl-tRNA hydrolase n=1 Tax=marine sediment metagenome TaxID=412755 RepID=A0A0F9HCR0_9ZZZZ